MPNQENTFVSLADVFNQRWTAERALAWYAQQPWLRGCNYNPGYAVNQIAMWQADTFDPAVINRELGWAQALGFNTMRVFLHDQLWAQDPDGFTGRIDQFLGICKTHGIKPMLVLFDSCWDPMPHLGPQRAPEKGVHNSGWVQGPGAAALADTAQEPRLQTYVTGVVDRFRADNRILCWDVWNEPDNMNEHSYGAQSNRHIELPHWLKEERVFDLLPKVFAWARAARPEQPLTSGPWKWRIAPPGETAASTFTNAGDTPLQKPEAGDDDRNLLTRIEKIQLSQSDITSFHNYDGPAEFERRVAFLQSWGRPILCTEYMARPTSLFKEILPICERNKVAAINWGFVKGAMQTHLHWRTWSKPEEDDKCRWFHDILDEMGEPHDSAECDFLRSLAKPEESQSKSFTLTSPPPPSL